MITVDIVRMEHGKVAENWDVWQDWAKIVYKPDIKDKWDKLYKKPGYDENDLIRFK